MTKTTKSLIGIGILAGAATGGVALGITLSHRDNIIHQLKTSN